MTTGIKPNDELCQTFANSKDGSVRVLKMEIHDEEIVLSYKDQPRGSFKDDYESMVLPLLDDRQPCYLLFRLDTKNDLGYEWLYLNYVPDFAPVRQKMLYAGSRATLRQEFGDGLIVDSIHGTDKGDVSYEGYVKHKHSKNAPAPLTMAEYELEEIKTKEIAHTALDTGAVTMKGITFPLTDEAVAALQQFRDYHINYLQLKIDTTNEIIGCESPMRELSVEQLPSVISREEQRYHLFRFLYTHESERKDSIIFIYSICGYKNPIKERMLYSSCKNNLISALENVHNIHFDRKIETETPEDELTAEAFIDALHPTKEDTRPKFNKPKGPGGARGPRRLIK